MMEHSVDPSLRLTDATGARCRIVRKLRDLTLLEVGARCGTSPQTIQRLEAGTMMLTLDWLELIAAALGVNPVVLLDETIELDFEKIKQAAIDRVSQQAVDWTNFIDGIMKEKTEKWLPPKPSASKD